jgi:hypothetical protein
MCPIPREQEILHGGCRYPPRVWWECIRRCPKDVWSSKNSFLITEQIQVQAGDGSTWSHLHLARSGGHAELTYIHHGHGTDLATQAEGGFSLTPFDLLYYFGHTRIVELLFHHHSIDLHIVSTRTNKTRKENSHNQHRTAAPRKLCLA